jgi:alkylation response protein AidB-like acyl-CoA dehydrogenase
MTSLEEVKSWVRTSLPDLASQHHGTQELSETARESLRDLQLMAPFLPAEFSGAGQSYRTTMQYHQMIGSRCAASRTLLTVHAMVARAILRFGTPAQQKRWLPELATGRVIGCFALSEERSGSDAQDVQVTAASSRDQWLISGKKKWISMGEVADICLVFAREGDSISAFLLELSPDMVTPRRDNVAVRGGMMADLHFDGASAQRLGPVGAGLLFVLQDALTLGRLSVAAGALGAAQACISAAATSVRTGKGGRQPLIEKQLVASQIGEMAVQIHTADLVLSDAAWAFDDGASNAATRACAAKLLASRTCASVSESALHLIGANGLAEDNLVSRHFRDAQAWRLIEGTDEVLKLVIADAFGDLTGKWP